MFSPETFKKFSFKFFVLAMLAMAFVCEIRANDNKANKIILEKGSASYGVIKGVIIDDHGNALARAVISIFRAGTLKILKQVTSSADGSFLTRVVPGTYSLLARAEGFDSVSLDNIPVNRSAEVYYGLRMERAGSGRTFAEKKIDRDSPKWRIRAAQSQRSIYQAGDGPDSTVAAMENKPVDNGPEVDERVGSINEESRGKRRGQSLVETYAASSSAGNPYLGVNFATVQPLGENSRIILAGQTGTSSSAPNRFETVFETRLNKTNQLRLTAAMAKLGTFNPGKQQGEEKELGQVSFQATDQWQVREGLILVYGFDYARFMGAGSDGAITPRLGLQYDVNAKTRLNASYTGSNEERVWQSVVEMEGEPILFRTSDMAENVAETSGQPVLNKNRRFEVGFERVLDNRSSIEAAAFFDTFSGRGVGLTGLPMDFLGGSEDDALVQTVNQSGKSQGFRITYNRRFSKMFSAAAGYAFGRGQKLSPDGLTDPQALFVKDLFQTFIAQFSADLQKGTKVKTIFRLSPQATVFAIDPFAGKMAIYDPSISILIVQSLPNWGLPFRAEAVIDARNLLDYAIQAQSEEGTVRLNSCGRGIRGGISVRF